MLKLFGGFLIIISSIVASYFYEKNLKRKIHNCRDFINFFEYIRAQIEYFSIPLLSIFERYESKSDDIADLIEKGETNINDSKINGIINDCFSSLGKGYKKEQLNLLSYAINELDKEADNMESVYTSKVKVFRALSLFTGVCTVILLV